MTFEKELILNGRQVEARTGQHWCRHCEAWVDHKEENCPWNQKQREDGPFRGTSD